MAVRVLVDLGDISEMRSGLLKMLVGLEQMKQQEQAEHQTKKEREA